MNISFSNKIDLAEALDTDSTTTSQQPQHQNKTTLRHSLEQSPRGGASSKTGTFFRKLIWLYNSACLTPREKDSKKLFENRITLPTPCPILIEKDPAIYTYTHALHIYRLLAE